VDEALPIFLEKVVPEPYMAIIISITLVLFFGEIIPQALCTRYGLAIGYFFSPFVWFLIVLEFIIAYPISKILDCVVGEHHTAYFRRAELQELVNIHGEEDEHNVHETLTDDEVKVIKGALSMQEKKVYEITTPLNEVFSVPIDSEISKKLLDTIIERGHSRIPVYRKTPEHIVGIVVAKSLINLHTKKNLRIDDLDIIRIPTVSSDTPLFSLLNQFIQGKSHMACIQDSSDNLTILGIVCLEDLIEALLGKEIYDESDHIPNENKPISIKDDNQRILVKKGSTFSLAYSLKQSRKYTESTPLIVNNENNIN